MYPFELKKAYSFSVYPAAILGNNFSNCTVLAIMDYESALQALPDLAATQANVYPYLPQGTPREPSSYDFVKIRMASGAITIVAVPWINLATVAVVESRKMTIVIDGVGSVDVERVRGALVQNGYNNLTIEIG